MTATSSRHLVDPQLLPLLDSLPVVDLDHRIALLMRSAPAQVAVAAADIDRTDMTTCLVPGPAGAPEVSVAIYRPRSAVGDLPCIFHIHGGGYVMGSVAGLEFAHRPMAADLNCCIVSVDYRLAPETVFPGAIEDCYAALKWLFAEAAALKIDTRRIGVMGESAGGGLAAALALLVRDRGEFSLAFQHLIFPMIDDRTCAHPDPHPFAGEFVWTPQKNHFGWSSLLGVPPGSEGVSPYAAAARAEKLEGLPPAYIATGSLDLFLEEDLEYARRLLRAGVPTELHVYPG
ncbi:MAG: alpha/beta hydrolase, partial [Hyphomonadaceae bacterium]